MNRARRLAALALAGLLTAGLAAVALRPGSTAPTSPLAATPSVADRIAEDFGRLPLRFEANRGQVDRQVKFLSRGPGYSIFLTPSEAVLSLSGGKTDPGAVVRMRLLGANPAPAVAGVDRLPGETHYLTGSDRKRWSTNVPSFAQVRYRDAYPGIDLIYHGRQRQLEYDFVVAPNVDPGAITLKISGGDRPIVDRHGDLVIKTPGGELRQDRPVVYQRVAGERRVVPGRYELKGDGRVGFRLGPYDRSRPLVIDPVLSYATYLGGAGADSPSGIAVDSAGSAYVSGSTASTDFPTAGMPFRAVKAAGTDAFVAKLNPAGSALVYSTYLGGGGADSAGAIAVDSAGNAFVTGSTTSADFPTAGAQQAAKGAGTTADAFVAKLAPDGSTLAYSTYLGGGGADVGRGIAVDAGGAYVTGSTASTNFPTASPLQPAKGAGATTDAFLTKYSADGSALTYSTYLGGAGADTAFGVAVEAGSAYVTGQTASSDFPTASPLQATSGGGTDAFVTKVDESGSALSYSTYLGGAGDDNADGIAVSAGSAYVAGDTESTDFPTVAALQNAYGGGTDAFVSKLDAAGSALSYSTYLGGSGFDGANAIAVDASERASVVGSTSSGDYPARSPLAIKEGNADFFAAQLSAAGSQLNYSTPLGGSASESGTGIAVDGSGNAYLTGSSNRYADGDFATTGPAGPFQADNAGATDAIVAKIVADEPAAPLVTGLQTRSGPSTGGTSVQITGRGFTGASAVTFGGTPAASFVVNSDTSITAVSPARPAGVAAVRVTTAGGTSPANPVARFEYAEGTWSPTGPLNVARFAHTTTLLENGKVLAAAGRLSPDSLRSAELYDPKLRTWSLTGSLSDTRFGHTATLLRGSACQGSPRPAYCGKVLVAGGFTGSSSANAQPVLDSAELYDPVTGTWSPAGTLRTRRGLHTATLLQDGRVLVAGGRTCDQPPPAQCAAGGFRTNTAEIYDPATNTWAATGSMAIARHTNGAALLPNGKVLNVAGFAEDDTSSELYTPASDPANGSWASCPLPQRPTPDCPGSLAQGRARAGATLLPNGKVIVAAGFPNNDTSELYDPATGEWSTTGRLRSFGRFNFYYALLPNGRFLLAGGGNGGSTAEVYDPATGEWSSAGRMSVAHGTSSSVANSQEAVVLSGDPSRFVNDPAVCGDDCGKVLISGNTELRSTELYTPEGIPGPITPAEPAAPAGPAPAPPAGSGPAAVPTPPAAAARRFTAKLALARATINRRARMLDVLAPITSLASGRARVELHAAGRRFRFTAPVNSRDGRIRFQQRIPAAQARLGTGILTIRYPGDGDTRPQTVRLRAASQRADLRLTRPRIVDGRLRASGTVSRRARGVVRVQLEYVVGGETTTLQFLAPITNGRWSLNRALSQSVRDAIARRTGTVHSYTLFTGYYQARMRGEMRSFQVLGAR